MYIMLRREEIVCRIINTIRRHKRWRVWFCCLFYFSCFLPIFSHFRPADNKIVSVCAAETPRPKFTPPAHTHTHTNSTPSCSCSSRTCARLSCSNQFLCWFWELLVSLPYTYIVYIAIGWYSYATSLQRGKSTEGSFIRKKSSKQILKYNSL